MKAWCVCEGLVRVWCIVMQGAIPANSTTIFRQAVAVAGNGTAALASVVGLVTGFETAWTEACTLMEARWWDAFNSTADRGQGAGASIRIVNAKCGGRAGVGWAVVELGEDLR